MPTPQFNENSFLTYSFLPEEELTAKILSPLQGYYLQSLRTGVLIQKGNLIYDPEHPLKFLQEEAYMKARMDIYNELLAESRDAQMRLMEIQNNTPIASN